MTKGWNNIDYPITALAGLTVLLVGGVLTWDDVLAERNGWDVFVWYGAIYQMARALTEAGVTRVLAQAVGQLISGTIWWAALLVLVFIYVYAHYAFATITAHVSAFYAAFLVVIIAAGAPPYLAVLSMSYVSSLGASLTHYGTTTSPIYYGAGYVSQGAWWRIGFLVATINTLRSDRGVARPNEACRWLLPGPAGARPGRLLTDSISMWRTPVGPTRHGCPTDR
jgi:DASS family divalent anion:Na+ symporter